MTNIINKAEKIADILKNFSNKDKLIILCYLGNNEKNVSEILNCCNISQSQVSQFLNKMKLEGILSSTKNWKEVYYKISDTKTLEIIEKLKQIF